MLLVSASLAITLNANAADEFKVKLQIEMVDHSSPEGVKIMVYEKGNLIVEMPTNENGAADFKLEKGKVYEIWMVREGFYTHLLHNVHDEGNTRHDIMLYKGISVGDFNAQPLNVNRTFIEVKAMNVPVEYLGDSVAIVTLSDLSKQQQDDLDKLAKQAKLQKKNQKKLDQLHKQKTKLQEEIVNLESSISAGSVDGLTGEKERLKLQKELVSIERKMIKYAY